MRHFKGDGCERPFGMSLGEHHDRVHAKTQEEALAPRGSMKTDPMVRILLEAEAKNAELEAEISRLRSALREIVEAGKILAEVREGRCSQCNAELAPEGYCGCEPIYDETVYERTCRMRVALSRAESALRGGE